METDHSSTDYISLLQCGYNKSSLSSTYSLVLAELPALIGGGALGEPAQYHLLLQDLQLVHVHQDLSDTNSQDHTAASVSWCLCVSTTSSYLDHGRPVALLLQEVLLEGRQTVQMVLSSLHVVLEHRRPLLQKLRGGQIKL